MISRLCLFLGLAPPPRPVAPPGGFWRFLWGSLGVVVDPRTHTVRMHQQNTVGGAKGATMVAYRMLLARAVCVCFVGVGQPGGLGTCSTLFGRPIRQY